MLDLKAQKKFRSDSSSVSYLLRNPKSPGNQEDFLKLELKLDAFYLSGWCEYSQDSLRK